MSETVLRAESLSVSFGRKVALEGVSLEVAEGSVYAILGRNGAGKSSLVRCLTGQLRPDSGAVAIFGEDVWRGRGALMERVGVVGEEPDAPAAMRVRELAWFSSRLYPRWSGGKFEDTLRRFAIDPAARFGELSKGQKKQVQLALALAADPRLLILDDPTLGLDVVARKSLFEEVIAEMADRGMTVAITTHDLASVETIADRVGILRGGRIVLDEEVETLKSRFRRMRFAGRPEVLAEAQLVAATVRQWGSGTEAIVTNYELPAFERLRSQASFSADVSPMSLEEIFLAVAGEEHAERGEEEVVR